MLCEYLRLCVDVCMPRIRRVASGWTGGQIPLPWKISGYSTAKASFFWPNWWDEVARWRSGLVLWDLIITHRHSDHGFETRPGKFFSCPFSDLMYWKWTLFVGYKQKCHQRSGSNPTLNCRSNLSTVAWRTPTR